MNWGECKGEAPELAILNENQFYRSGLFLVGNLRKNGRPRISPVDAHIVDENLYLEMMWPSRKALDLVRNPRCTVHITVSNRDGNEGAVKLYGRANDAQDAATLLPSPDRKDR